MTIEEAYEAMCEGHKVAHGTYDQDEFNWMSQMEVIYDENKYRCGYKWDKPWKERIESDWAQHGWFICDEREFVKPKLESIGLTLEFSFLDESIAYKTRKTFEPIEPFEKQLIPKLNFRMENKKTKLLKGRR